MIPSADELPRPPLRSPHHQLALLATRPPPTSPMDSLSRLGQRISENINVRRRLASLGFSPGPAMTDRAYEL
jgi:hypothetical protein